MKIRKLNNSCLVILEFGIPHYRKFIFDWLSVKFKQFYIIHSGEKFDLETGYNQKKCINIKIYKNISLCLFDLSLINKYDIIISTLNFRKPHTWLPFLLCRNKKWLYWGQGPGRSSNIFINKLKKYLINQSMGYVVYTPSGKEELEKIGVSSEKISIAYNTLKIDNSEITFGSKYLLYVGRIQKRKGLDKILYAIKNTSRKLVVVGDGGDYENEFVQLVDTLGLKNQVILKGSIYDDQKLKSIFSDSIAYVSPDHVGLGVVHAFAYGVPVVVCKNRDHAPEITYCNDTNSYIYESDSDLKEVLKKIFNNEKLRNKKRVNAYKFYQDNLNHTNVYDSFDYHLKPI